MVKQLPESKKYDLNIFKISDEDKRGLVQNVEVALLNGDSRHLRGCFVNKEIASELQTLVAKHGTKIRDRRGDLEAGGYTLATVKASKKRETGLDDYPTPKEGMKIAEDYYKKRAALDLLERYASLYEKGSEDEKRIKKLVAEAQRQLSFHVAAKEAQLAAGTEFAVSMMSKPIAKLAAIQSISYYQTNNPSMRAIATKTLPHLDDFLPQNSTMTRKDGRRVDLRWWDNARSPARQVLVQDIRFEQSKTYKPDFQVMRFGARINALTNGLPKDFIKSLQNATKVMTHSLKAGRKDTLEVAQRHLKKLGVVAREHDHKNNNELQNDGSLYKMILSMKMSADNAYNMKKTLQNDVSKEIYGHLLEGYEGHNVERRLEIASLEPKEAVIDPLVNVIIEKASIGYAAPAPKPSVEMFARHAESAPVSGQPPKWMMDKYWGDYEKYRDEQSRKYEMEHPDIDSIYELTMKKALEAQRSEVEKLERIVGIEGRLPGDAGLEVRKNLALSMMSSMPNSQARYHEVLKEERDFEIKDFIEVDVRKGWGMEEKAVSEVELRPTPAPRPMGMNI